ncbi:MAG: cation transporter [Fibrobacteres bacterium]|nr:cation transporter [Fibrobacterota bacterium]
MNQEKNREKSTAAAISVGSNAILVVGKMVAGIAIGSVSVISEAIHSAVDLLAAIIAWFAVRASGQPADKEHPYGHGKYENLSGAVEGALIFVAAIWIIYEAVHKLRVGGGVEAPGWGMLIMAISATANLIVSTNLMRVGKKHDSLALIADAMHLRTDVWTSVGVFAGLVIIWIGKIVFPSVNLSWVDPVCAIAVALLIIHAAWELTTNATRGLLDEALPEEEIAFIHKAALDRGDIRSLHDLKTRKAGPERIIDAHVAVDWDLSVLEGHNRGKSFKRTLLDNWEHCTINIHVDACDGACGAPCKSGCLLPPEEQVARHVQWKENRKAD